MSIADNFNQTQIARGKLKPEHITELVRFWQREHGLDADGMAGAATLATFTHQETPSGPPALPTPRCYPMRAFADGRKPHVTSSHKNTNPSRPTHNGCDLFYRYDDAKDAAIAPGVGDGGRTRSGWFIPNDWPAIAGASGTIEVAGPSPTGFRMWIDIGGGWHLGYFHLSSLLVAKGDIVEMGTPVGIVGDNPIDGDARHLHFELYFGDLNTYPRGTRDPQAFLEGAKVLPAK